MERCYESMMIVRSDLTEEELEKVFSKISKKVEDCAGKVLNSRIWAKDKVFAYPLRSRGAGKKKFNKGCYWLINFNLDTDKLKDLKEAIRLEENILRSLIIRKEKSDK
jgi:ribosomal protein S6